MKLPVLSQLVKKVGRIPDFEDVVFVCLQKLTQTTELIPEALIALGAKPQNIFLGAITQDINHLWQVVQQHLMNSKKITTIILLDYEGQCFKNIPKKIFNLFLVIGVEQSSNISAYACHSNFPFVYIDIGNSVANSILQNSRLQIVTNNTLLKLEQNETSLMNELQLNSALVVGGLIQALKGLQDYRRNVLHGSVMLDPYLQKFVVTLMTSSFKYYQNIDNFSNIYWIIKNSKGLFHEIPCFYDYFTKHGHTTVYKVVVEKSCIKTAVNV